jgi:hypothetical protein
LARFHDLRKNEEREREKKRKGSANAKIGKFQAFFCGGFDLTFAKISKKKWFVRDITMFKTPLPMNFAGVSAMV